MEIKKYHSHLNDETCIVRTLSVSNNEIDIEKDKYGCNKPTQKYQNKYFDLIKETIDLTEEKIESTSVKTISDESFFKVYSIENWRVEKQEEIRKIVSDALDTEIDEYQINIEADDTIRIYPTFSLNKDNVTKLQRVLNRSNWYIGFQDYGETCFLYLGE